MADLRGGVLPGGRAARGSPRTASSCSRPLCSGRNSTRRCTRRHSPCSARTASSTPRGPGVSCSRSPGRSTRGRTRCSAALWPSGFSACRGSRAAMRFALDEEALALRDAAAGLLAAEVSPEVIRAGWPGGKGDLVAAAWRRLARVGAAGTLVPQERGGLGLDENALVPLLEELGRSGLPGPAAETIAVAAPLLAGPGLGRPRPGWHCPGWHCPGWHCPGWHCPGGRTRRRDPGGRPAWRRRPGAAGSQAPLVVLRRRRAAALRAGGPGTQAVRDHRRIARYRAAAVPGRRAAGRCSPRTRR